MDASRFQEPQHGHRGRRNRSAHLFEDPGKLGYDEVQQNSYRGYAHTRQQTGVDQCRDQVTPQLVCGAFKLYQPAQDGVEHTAGLTGSNHVHIQPRELLGMCSEPFSERFAALDLLKDVVDHDAQGGLGCQLRRNSEAAVQWKAGMDKSCKLFREEQNILPGNATQIEFRKCGSAVVTIKRRISSSTSSNSNIPMRLS